MPPPNFTPILLPITIPCSSLLHLVLALQPDGMKFTSHSNQQLKFPILNIPSQGGQRNKRFYLMLFSGAISLIYDSKSDCSKKSYFEM